MLRPKIKAPFFWGCYCWVTVLPTNCIIKDWPFLIVCYSSEDLTSTTIFFLSIIDPNYTDDYKNVSTYFFQSSFSTENGFLVCDFCTLKHLLHHVFFLSLFGFQICEPGKKLIFAQSHHITLHPIDLILLQLLLDLWLTDLIVWVLNHLSS